MPLFSYRALDVNGAERAGRLDAPDMRQAAGTLRERGLFPTEVARTPVVAEKERVEDNAPASHAVPAARFGFSLHRPAGAKEVAVFTRQLATLLRAGVPLLRGLEMLVRQEHNHGFRRILHELAERIRSGRMLSEAMAQHPCVFDRLYVNMVRAGEAGGMLDLVMDRLARFQEKSRQLRGKLAAAMVYPLIVLAAAGAILAGLLVFVVPRFKQIFADLLKGAPLPELTQWVLGISEAVRNNFHAAIGAMVLAGILLKLFKRTEAGARWFGVMAIKLPLFGPLLLKAIIARFGRTLGTLLSSGVPILPALLITRDTCGNSRVAAAITEVHDRVKEGASVARPLQATQVFPPMVCGLVDVGEHTGRLGEMLGQVADIYEEEVDTVVAGISSLIEPVLILFLALVVGTIVIALFLPIVRIVQLMT